MTILSACTTDTIIGAAQALIDGALVVFPTETVYGLGADATNPVAVARIYSTKGRPENHPLIVHIPSIDSIGDWASAIPEYAITLARDFWPGPLTMVVTRSALAGDFITGGQNTVGLRVPAQPLALALLKSFVSLGGKGVAAPSANRFGAVSPTTATAVEEELGLFLDLDRDLILDGGPSLVGVESTIVDCTGLAPRILRLGAITVAMIEESTGLKVEAIVQQEIRVSGSLDSHYSPKARVVLDAIAEGGDGFIAWSTVPTPTGAIRLASPSNIEQYARDLYAALRLGDQLGLTTIAVLQPEGKGLADRKSTRLNSSH